MSGGHFGYVFGVVWSCIGLEARDEHTFGNDSHILLTCLLKLAFVFISDLH